MVAFRSSLIACLILFSGCAARSGMEDGMRRISDGPVSFRYDPSVFGLATESEQVQALSYIPPCESGFTYCLYLAGGSYSGTNFESAGLAVTKRADLTTKEACLRAPPAGYERLQVSVADEGAYSASAFSPLGDAAMGHYANDGVYRLFAADTCLEFRTRIGETQYANYPEGSIRRFTDADRDAVRASLRAVLDDVALAGGAHVTFPQPPASAFR